MANWNPEILDKYVAPEISEFTSADIRDLRDEHEGHLCWLTNHFFNNALRAPFKGAHRQYAINFIFRAQTDFDYYHQAREITIDYLEFNNPHNPRITQYYKAIILWETSFINWAICLDIVKSMISGKVFEKRDGSEEQKAYGIYNEIKHCGGNIKNKTIVGNLTIPLWLTNSGFSSVSNSITYAEFSGLLEDAAKLADELQDPIEFLESNQTNPISIE